MFLLFFLITLFSPTIYALNFESQDFCIETPQEVTLDMENLHTHQTISFGTFDLGDTKEFHAKHFHPDKKWEFFNYFKQGEINVVNKESLWRLDSPAMTFWQTLMDKKKFPSVGFLNSLSNDKNLAVVKLFVLDLPEQQNAQLYVNTDNKDLLLSIYINALKIKLATGAHKDIILTLKNSERYQISNVNVRRIDDLSNPIIKNEFDMFKKEFYPL